MLAIKEHVGLTNKKVFISYILLAGINDSREHAKELVRLIKNQGEKTYLYHVNLIRFNPGATYGTFSGTTTATIRAFQSVLKAAGVSNTLRENFGVNIAAACGQLYGKYEQAKR